jgi:hypothetical protein
MMKHVILGIVLGIVLVGGVAEAKRLFINGVKIGEVTSGTVGVDVYRLDDVEKGVSCYYSFMSQKANIAPVVSCVK